ncbi:phosphoesterase [Clostridia bacterium]|nr:phosphoesterase [Clostridia bacterium]
MFGGESLGDRIIVMSDSHGKVTPMKEIVRHNPEVKTFFFLGDGEGDIEHILREYPCKNIYRVRGNCDFGNTIPLLFSTTLEYSNVTITAVHGHLQNVKITKSYLHQLAKDTNADIVLYGHTHKPEIVYDDGIYYVCPGSVSESRSGGNPTFAFIDITDDGHIVCSIAPVPPFTV